MPGSYSSAATGSPPGTPRAALPRGTPERDTTLPPDPSMWSPGSRTPPMETPPLAPVVGGPRGGGYGTPHHTPKTPVFAGSTPGTPDSQRNHAQQHEGLRVPSSSCGLSGESIRTVSFANAEGSLSNEAAQDLVTKAVRTAVREKGEQRDVQFRVRVLDGGDAPGLQGIVLPPDADRSSESATEGGEAGGSGAPVKEKILELESRLREVSERARWQESSALENERRVAEEYAAQLRKATSSHIETMVRKRLVETAASCFGKLLRYSAQRRAARAMTPPPSHAEPHPGLLSSFSAWGTHPSALGLFEPSARAASLGSAGGAAPPQLPGAGGVEVHWGGGSQQHPHHHPHHHHHHSHNRCCYCGPPVIINVAGGGGGSSGGTPHTPDPRDAAREALRASLAGLAGGGGGGGGALDATAAAAGGGSGGSPPLPPPHPALGAKGGRAGSSCSSSAASPPRGAEPGAALGSPAVPLSSPVVCTPLRSIPVRGGGRAASGTAAAAATSPPPDLSDPLSFRRGCGGGGAAAGGGYASSSTTASTAGGSSCSAGGGGGGGVCAGSPRGGGPQQRRGGSMSQHLVPDSPLWAGPGGWAAQRGEEEREGGWAAAAPPRSPRPPHSPSARIAARERGGTPARQRRSGSSGVGKAQRGKSPGASAPGTPRRRRGRGASSGCGGRHHSSHGGGMWGGSGSPCSRCLSPPPPAGHTVSSIAKVQRFALPDPHSHHHHHHLLHHQPQQLLLGPRRSGSGSRPRSSTGTPASSPKAFLSLFLDTAGSQCKSLYTPPPSSGTPASPPGGAAARVVHGGYVSQAEVGVVQLFLDAMLDFKQRVPRAHLGRVAVCLVVGLAELEMSQVLLEAAARMGVWGAAVATVGEVVSRVRAPRSTCLVSEMLSGGAVRSCVYVKGVPHPGTMSEVLADGMSCDSSDDAMRDTIYTSLCSAPTAVASKAACNCFVCGVPCSYAERALAPLMGQFSPKHATPHVLPTVGNVLAAASQYIRNDETLLFSEVPV